jgi:hypothetical protein
MPTLNSGAGSIGKSFKTYYSYCSSSIASASYSWFILSKANLNVFSHSSSVFSKNYLKYLATFEHGVSGSMNIIQTFLFSLLS